MKSLEEKRDEACIEYVGFGYGCDGDTSADSFKAGWDACAEEYEKENKAMKEHYDLIIERCNHIADLDGKDYAVLLSEKENLRLHLLSECKNHKLTQTENTELQRQLEIAKEALKQIEHGNGLMRDASRSEKIAYKALNELSGKTGELK